MNSTASKATDERDCDAVLFRTGPLEVGYGAEVLACLDLEVRRRSCIVLIGPNGSGKSTLLRTIAGLIPPIRGTAPALDFDVEFVGSPRTAAGAMRMRVAEIVAMGRYRTLGLMRRFRRKDRDAVAAALDALAIADKKHACYNDLSIGQRRRVDLARAFAAEPALYLLDEPTAGVDDVGRVRFLAALRARLDEGAAAIVATHEKAEIDFADMAVDLGFF